MINDNKNRTVLVAMSGGVDSSVAARLLHDQGYDVIGVTMKLWDYESVGGNINHESGCCSLSSFNDARQICVSMGIPHYILNFSREFHKHVVEDFIDEYLSGRTPNPCVRCNTKIKWQTLLEKADELNADYIATGHYARVQLNPDNGRTELLRALDKNKDQSYALWGIRQSSLARTLFPLGDMTKPQVRDLARRYRLVTAEKKESQEICFIPDNNYHRLLKSQDRTPARNVSEGELVNLDGKVVGLHQGYPFYTIGQRKGLGGGFSEPTYVVDVDAGRNRVTVGPKEALDCRSFYASDINLISMKSIESPLQAEIKIRYNDTGHPGTLHPCEKGLIKVVFDQPQRAVTPGQSAVFFSNDRVIGGGIIKERV
jgi:tRNA-specific 2-thiouridylase